MLEQLCILSCKWKQSSEISLLMFMEIPVSCFMNHDVSTVKLIIFYRNLGFFYIHIYVVPLVLVLLELVDWFLFIISKLQIFNPYPR